MKILYTLVGMGSTTLAAAVTYLGRLELPARDKEEEEEEEEEEKGEEGPLHDCAAVTYIKLCCVTSEHYGPPVHD